MGGLSKVTLTGDQSPSTPQQEGPGLFPATGERGGRLLQASGKSPSLPEPVPALL